MTVTTVGRNTVSGEKLQSLVERIEAIRARKADCAIDEGFVFAEAKTQGFVGAGLRTVLKLRAMKPSDRQEAEAIRDQYLHALGMEAQLPLFRHVGLIAVDIASRESVIEALKGFVPENGAITIEAGGKPVRLSRDKAGTITVAEVTPAAPAAPRAGPAPSPGLDRPAREIPLVDDAGAVELGRAAYREDAPIITNPFPFGDARRPRWDEGWRKESGTDGMGPGR